MSTLIAWVSLLAVGQSAGVGPPRVVVLDFVGPDTALTERRQVTESTLVALGRAYGQAIVGEGEASLLAEHAEDRHEVGACRDEDCAAEIARLASVELALTGAVLPLGNEWLLSLTLLDASSSIPKTSRSITAPTVAALEAEAGPLAVAMLAGLGGAGPTGSSTTAVTHAKVAVLDLGSIGAPVELAATLTQILLLELRKLGDLSVISRDEVRALFDYEVERQIASCDQDDQCLAEIGGALGVDYLITGGIGRFGDEWVVHLKLMRPRQAEVVARAAERFRGPQSELVPALRMTLLALLGRPLSRGRLALVGDDDVEVRIDGGPSRSLPLELALASGRHSLAFVGSGHHDLRRDLYVEPGATTRLLPELEPIPWWSRWTTWVAVGAVVVIGAGVTAALLDRAPERGTVDIEVVPR